MKILTVAFLMLVMLLGISAIFVGYSGRVQSAQESQAIPASWPCKDGGAPQSCTRGATYCYTRNGGGGTQCSCQDNGSWGPQVSCSDFKQKCSKEGSGGRCVKDGIQTR